MKFICDVHISIRLSKRLNEEGFDCTHVNQLPSHWRTSDSEIALIADREDRILISKDSDFRNSCIVKGTPQKLIKVNLGNIPDQTLIDLLLRSIVQLEKLNERSRFLVEIDLNRMSQIDLDR
ncbi:MAG: DUF5615 family PIN-like protein [Bacteroidota bacterium]|nr:DUF5615 family PIN-like protein [Bacteroidota bacterium]